MTTENLSEPGSQITFLKRVVWLGRSTMSGASTYSTNLRRRQVTNNGVRPPKSHSRTRPDPSSETFGIQGPEAYAYTSMSNCLDVSGIDDVKDFEETIVSSAFRASRRPSLTPLDLSASHADCRSLTARANRGLPDARDYLVARKHPIR